MNKKEKEILGRTKTLLNKIEKKHYQQLSEAKLLSKARIRQYLLDFLYGPAKRTFSSNTLVFKLVISLWAVGRKLKQVPKNNKLLYWSYIITIISYSLALLPAIIMKPIWLRIIRTIFRLTYRLVPKTSMTTRAVSFSMKYGPSIMEFLVKKPVVGLVVSLFSGVLSGILLVFAEGIKYVSGSSVEPNSLLDKVLQKFTIKGRDYMNLYKKFIFNLSTHLMKIGAIFGILFALLKAIYTKLVGLVTRIETKLKKEIDKEKREAEEEKEEEIQEAEEEPVKKSKDMEESFLSRFFKIISKFFNFILRKTMIGSFIGIFMWVFFGSNKLGKKFVKSFPAFRRIYTVSVMRAKPLIRKLKLRQAIRAIKEFIKKIVRFFKFKENVASTQMS